MGGIVDIFNLIILQPMLNALLWLYSLLGDQFWLAIIVFTIFVRALMTPLMLPQQRSAKKMQEIQPRLEELKKKYGKDRERMSQEQMKLYREAGVNPMGGCLPLLVQFPIWIGLYQSIIQALGFQPLQLLGLSKNIYPFLSAIWVAVPLNRYFLGMDLALSPSELQMIPVYSLPVLVAFTSWLQSKMTTSTTSGAGQTASMNQSMTMMMPLMFGFFSLNFPTGLSFYFVVSNIIGIITQGFISGWEGLMFWKGFSLSNILPFGAKPAPEPTSSKKTGTQPTSSSKGTQSGSKKKRKKKRRRKR